MKKSFLSILLTISMVSASCMPAFGTETVTGEEIVVTETATEEEASETEEAVVEETKSEETGSDEELVTEEAAAEENETEESEAEEEAADAEAEADAQETESEDEAAVEETGSDEAAAEEDASVEAVTEESDTADTETGAAVSGEELTVEAASDAVQKEAAAAEAGAEEDVVIEDVVIEIHNSVPDDGISCDEMFAAYVDEVFGTTEFSDGKLKGKSVKAGSKLNDSNKAIYNYIGGQLELIADGERTSTVFYLTKDNLNCNVLWTAEELGVDSIVENGSITEEAQNAVSNKINLNKIVDALLADYPYLLYWFDKTEGYTVRISITAGTYNGVLKCGIGDSSSISFSVSNDFDVEDEEYQVDSSVGQTVRTAAENANAIVDDNSGKQDLDILTAYCDKICELTSYNDEAAGDGYTGGYGNPWQLIWVFDGDDKTNVVCEGYSKAFKFLCDNTSFSADIGCILVTGSMDGGAHMWNIVSMDDDCNYLVDVTNTDSGFDLFLLGGEGSVDSGYTFSGIQYVYDEDTTGLWDTDELTLKVHNYGAHVSSDWTVTKPATCTEKGSRQKVCTLCGDVLETEEIAMIGHDLEHFAANAATCTEDGNTEYWKCNNCGKFFSDAAGTTEIAEADIVVAKGHKLSHVDAKAATCTEDGNIEYWKCSECGKFFSDEDGTTEIAEADIVVAKGHKLSHVDAKAATCTEDGNIEYWKCSECGKFFSDEDGTTEIAEADIVVAKGHNLFHVDATAATCTEDSAMRTERQRSRGQILWSRRATNCPMSMQRQRPAQQTATSSIGSAVSAENSSATRMELKRSQRQIL